MKSILHWIFVILFIAAFIWLIITEVYYSIEHWDIAETHSSRVHAFWKPVVALTVTALLIFATKEDE